MLKVLRISLIIAMVAMFQTTYAQTLVHYWNFNNSASEADLLAPTLSLVNGAGIEHIQGGSSAVQITSNTGQGFDITNPNARNGDAALTHLRFNNPIGGTLVFSAPTTGYQQIVVKYGTRRSGSGAGTQIIEYTLDGVSFDTLKTIDPVDGNPNLETLDFSGIAGVNDNANFKIRITFIQGPGGTVGNNRFDNVTLEGILAGVDNVPPVVNFTPTNGATEVLTTVQPTIVFNEDVRLLSDADIQNADIPNIVDLRLDSAGGTAVSFTGSYNSSTRTITVAPSQNLPSARVIYLALKGNTVEDLANNAVDSTLAATFTTLLPQTMFAAGDLVPVAYRMNASGADDEVALLSFVDILPGTKINLADAKYTDNAQPQCPGGIVWTSPNSIVPAGTVIYIQNDAGTASVGTITGSTFGLSSNGDQVIVYTGTASAPMYITALSSNAWVDNNTACGGSLSKRPAPLTDGVNSISLATAPGNTSGNTVNGYYNGPQTGTTAELRTAILDPANWNGIGQGTPPQVWPVYNFPGPPQVLGANVLSQTQIAVAFSRDMDAVTTTDLNNFTGIAGLSNIAISNNGALPDTVTLTYSTPFANGQTYTLAVANVKDTENRLLVGTFEYTFTYNTTAGFAGRFVSVSEDDGMAVVRINVQFPSATNIKLEYQGGVFSTASPADLNFPTTILPLDGGTSNIIEVSIPVVDDTEKEQDEYFVIKITDNGGAAINSPDFFTVYIRDNDRQAPVATQDIQLEFVSRYAVDNPTGEEGLAEIVAYDPGSQRLFTISTALGQFDIIDFSDPANPTNVKVVDMASYGSGVTSIAVRNGVVAVSVPGINNEQENGSVVFFNTNGDYINKVTVGALPDMITFTPDNRYLLTANEGQPNDAYTVDPEGSVSMIDLSGGVAALTQAQVTTLPFTFFNGLETDLLNVGVRKLKSTSTISQDFEPEYITVLPDSKKAWIVLQENNAFVELNLETKEYESIWALGTKDYNQFGNGLDLSDQSGIVHIANWPLKGFYLPDAIANYSVNGETYIVMANEGDEKEYAGLNERTTVGAVTLDPTVFPNAAMLKENHAMGRFRITNSKGDTDNDGDYDELYAVGARSFSIWSEKGKTVVYDSGDDFEMITASDPVTAPIFNADNGGNAFKNRSRAKGPEPEGVVLARLNDRNYAFIALERIGGVMTYDVTDPQFPQFVDYVNSRSNTEFAGDNGAEGIIFVPHANGKYYILTANEVSGTLAVFEVLNVTVSANEPDATADVVMFPNPVNGGMVYFSKPQTCTVTDMAGRQVVRVENALSINTSSWISGMYLVRFENGVVRKLVVGK